MEEKLNFAPLTLRKTAAVIADKDASSPNYFKGPDLVKLFNTLGYPDDYTFVEGRGIQTLDYGNGLSRLNYTIKRLEDLNKTFRVPEAIQKFIDMSQQPLEAINAIQEALKPFSIQISYNQEETQEEAISELSMNNDERQKKEDQSIIADGILEISKEQSQITDKEKYYEEQRKQLEDTILGKIPEGRKVAFISYSWDSEEHKIWVAKLADDMVKQGIFVLYDGYIDGGTPLNSFMELGMQRADKIVVIGTPDYCAKYYTLTSGASFEGCIVRSHIIQNIGTKKIIPCLKNGNFKTSFPMIISERDGYDFSKDEDYNRQLDDLCRDIWERPRYQRPQLGPIPDYAK